ncbi:hypothetical protein GCM10009660_11900 [Catellatospora bangladeshensis]
MWPVPRRRDSDADRRYPDGLKARVCRPSKQGRDLCGLARWGRAAGFARWVRAVGSRGGFARWVRAVGPRGEAPEVGSVVRHPQ